MTNLYDWAVTTRCDTAEITRTLDALRHHASANPEVAALFAERFPSLSDVFDFEPLTDGLINLRPSDALKSFMQDLL